jgi:hypothetical protein
MTESQQRGFAVAPAPRRKEVDLRLVPMGFAALILVGLVSRAWW